MRPGPGQQWTAEFFRSVVEPVYAQVDQELRAEVVAAVRAGRLLLTQAMVGHHHEVWLRVAARTGVHYDGEST